MEPAMDRTTRFSILSATLLAPAILLTGASAALAATTTEFDAYLRRGYSEVAAYAWSKVEDPAVPMHFEQKAAMADEGLSVAPDAPLAGDRELAAAHRQLLEALAAGAAQDEPRMTAVAQVNYDCWAADLGGAANGSDAASCRLLFYTAINQIAAAEDNITAFVTNAGPDAPDDARNARGNDQPGLLGAAPDAPPPAEGPLPPQAAPGTPAMNARLTPLIVPPGPEAESGQPDASDGSGQSAGNAAGGAGPGDAAGPAGGTVADTVGDTVGAVGDAVGETVGAVGGAVGGVADAVGGAVSGVGGAVGGLGGRLGGAE
jgi:hypothetical protein